MGGKTSGKFNRSRNCPLKNSRQITESNDMVDTEQSYSNKTCLKMDKIHSLDKIYDFTPFDLENLLDYTKVHLMNGSQLRNYAYALRDKVLEKIDDFPPCYQEELDVLCAVTDDDLSEKHLKILSSRMPVIIRRALDNEMSSNYRKPYGGNPRTHDKITVPENVCYAAAVDHKVSMKTDDASDDSEDYWDSEPVPNNSFIEDDTINRKNVKIEMQNKNLHAYDSNFSSNYLESVRANARKDQNFHTKESYNAPTNSVDNVQENAHKVKNETTFGKNRRCIPNVEAVDFVPFSAPSVFKFPYNYTPFPLESLLGYKIHLMKSDQLRSYAFTLRDKVLEKIDDFPLPYQEELDVLCALTDDDVNEKHLKILSSRMPVIVRRALNHMKSLSNRRSYGGNPRRPKHGNQNYFSGRKYQGK